MEIPSSITDKEIHNYLSEIKHQLAFTHSPKETASIMQMVAMTFSANILLPQSMI